MGITVAPRRIVYWQDYVFPVPVCGETRRELSLVRCHESTSGLFVARTMNLYCTEFNKYVLNTNKLQHVYNKKCENENENANV